MINSVKEILFLIKEKKKKLVLVVSLFLLLSLVDVVGISLVAPYINYIFNKESKVLDQLNVYIDKYYSSESDLLIAIGVVLIIIFLAKLFLALFVNYRILKFSKDVQLSLRTKLMSSYLSMNYNEFTRRNSSEFIFRIQSLVSTFSFQTLVSFLRIISDSLIILSISILLLYVNYFVFIILLLIISFCFFTYDILFRKRLIEFGEKVNFHGTLMVKSIKEGLSGLKEIRILGIEKYFLDQTTINSKKYGDYSTTINFLAITPKYIIESLFALLIIFFTIYIISTGNNINSYIQIMSIYAFASLRMLPCLNSVFSGLTVLRATRNSVSLLFEEFNTIKSGSHFHCKNANTVKEEFHLLKLKNVHFKHHESNVEILQEINLDIHRGQSIGIMGSSGSGKTTLMDLMLGLYEPNSGEILYNDFSLRDSLTIWRSQIAYLPQDNLIIDDTLKKNIAFGISDKDISETKLLDSITKASLDNLIDELPDGVNSSIGENGIRLSGGQKQRVAIARAFYHDRNILFLDETTSALDYKTENAIVSEFQKLEGNVTSIVIAHRLATLKYCDRIFEMVNKRLVERPRITNSDPEQTFNS